jgi:hypothetical protein
MKIAKTLAILACAGLLSAGTTSFARHAYAQDAADQDSGSWRTSDASSDDEATSPDSKAPPLDVDGCWEGTVTDTLDGEGEIVFEFDQDETKPTKLDNTSTIDFTFDITSGPINGGEGAPGLEGSIKGTVSSKGIKFSGKLPGCSYSGKASKITELSGRNGLDLTTLGGKIKFSGKCAKGFKGMTFEITPGCAP